MLSIPKSSVALLVVVSLGMLVHCGDEDVPSNVGTVEPSSSCPAARPEGGACFGVVSCTFVEGGCDSGVATYLLHQCFCDAKTWTCSTVEAQCAAAGGAGGSGGAGMGGSGGSGGG